MSSWLAALEIRLPGGNGSECYKRFLRPSCICYNPIFHNPEHMVLACSRPTAQCKQMREHGRQGQGSAALASATPTGRLPRVAGDRG